jgi:hypothetical protein
MSLLARTINLFISNAIDRYTLISLIKNVYSTNLSDAKQLLLAMLATKPHCRLTADELRKNEWILAGLRAERISPKIEP